MVTRARSSTVVQLRLPSSVGLMRMCGMTPLDMPEFAEGGPAGAPAFQDEEPEEDFGTGGATRFVGVDPEGLAGVPTAEARSRNSGNPFSGSKGPLLLRQARMLPASPSSRSLSERRMPSVLPLTV